MEHNCCYWYVKRINNAVRSPWNRWLRRLPAWWWRGCWRPRCTASALACCPVRERWTNCKLFRQEIIGWRLSLWLITDLTIGNDGATHGSFLKPGMVCNQEILTRGQTLTWGDGNYAKRGHKPHTAVSPVQGGHKREERNQPADGE